MNNYLITLTPVGRFFFGGDMTFSVKDNKEHNEKYSSYIIESNPFPQQTSLLGMLRFLILSNDSEAFDMDKQEIKAVAKERENQELSYVEKLIGATSFVLTENNAEQNFGKIRNLSSCILQMSQDGSNWENLLPTPPVFEKSVNFATATEASLNGKTILLPTINNYDAKEWYEALFSSSDNSIQLKSSDIFCKDQRIGIEKGMFYQLFATPNSIQ